jgi:hypothetical protein
LYKAGTDEDKTLAKKLKSSWRFFAPVIVREKDRKESELNSVWWSFSRTIYESIIRYCKNPEYGDISDPVKGTDLDVTVTPPKKKGEFAKTNISPKRLPTPLVSSQEELTRITANVSDLMKDTKVLSYEELTKIVDSWVKTNTTVQEQVEEEATTDETESADEIFKQISEIAK